MERSPESCNKYAHGANAVTQERPEDSERILASKWGVDGDGDRKPATDDEEPGFSNACSVSRGGLGHAESRHARLWYWYRCLRGWCAIPEQRSSRARGASHYADSC